jgi:hypothetical protein
MEDKKKNVKKQLGNLDDILNKLEAKPINQKAAWKKAVLDDKLFTQYPEWFEEIEVPHGTERAIEGGMFCWMSLVQARADEKPIIHPVHTVDELVMTNDLFFAKNRISYINEKNENVIVPCQRGYFITDSNAALSIGAAHVSDMCAYFTRIDDKKNVNPIADAEEMRKLAMMSVDVKPIRKLLDTENKSETKARDAMYQMCVENPEHGYMLCDAICRKTPPLIINSEKDEKGKPVVERYFAPNIQATEACQKYFKEIESPRVVEAVMLPSPGRILVPSNPDDIDEMWHYLLRSRAIRGDDNGLGSLTFGYIYGAMPRAVVKAITHFLDIRQCCLAYKTQNVLIQGILPELVLRMLIRNRFYVIYPAAGSLPALKVKDIKLKRYGMYSAVGKNITYGMYHVVHVEPSSVSKGVLKHNPVDFMARINFHAAHTTSILFHAMNAHITPAMEKKNREYGILPAAMAHNAQVICIYPSIKDIQLGDMIRRTFLANHLRNNWLITKRVWSIVDPFSQDVGYTISFVYPKMRVRAKIARKDFSTLFNKVSAEVDDVESINLSNLPEAEIPEGHSEDRLGLVQALAKIILKSSDVFGYVKVLVINWGTTKNLIPAMRLALFEDVTVSWVITELGKLMPKYFELIEQAYGEARDELEKGREGIDTPADSEDEDGEESSSTDDEEDDETVPEDLSDKGSITFDSLDDVKF